MVSAAASSRSTIRSALIATRRVYADATGVPVDPERLRWWEVLATVKWGVICQVQASRHLHGKPSVEHAAIGRRVSETELDLLLLIEEAR